MTISFVDEGTLATSRQAKHAELILKCIWKRARSVEDDLGAGLLEPIALLRIIEDFLQALPPTAWRKRAQTKVPLGDMPLRTVKVIIQHVVSKYGGERVYDQLSAAFDEPENTHAYAYIFRLGLSFTLCAQLTGLADRNPVSFTRSQPDGRGCLAASLGCPASHGRATGSYRSPNARGSARGDHSAAAAAAVYAHQASSG